jgi:predicted CoA-binding protein
MSTLREAADEFLAQRRIAVAGVSRDTKQPANLVYRRLRDTGHEACPNMFGATSDRGHKCLLAMLRLGGKVPRTV